MENLGPHLSCGPGGLAGEAPAILSRGLPLLIAGDHLEVLTSNHIGGFPLRKAGGPPAEGQIHMLLKII